MIGRTISRYKILEKIGEGAMGEVYLANDTDLHRKVALKFLPLNSNNQAQANSRFKREARAAAALNHPNIITVYEIGEFEGRTFIAMEFVEGQSLRDWLSQEDLPLSKTIDIMMQICEGLGEAHHAGIVHRDIKPENILITSKGRVKVADFGLAMIKGATRLTRNSSTLGTLDYMSPEQLQGEDVDNRSDIFSVGVVLYEMITGQRPFRGDYEATVSYAILNKEPEPLARYKTGVSEQLQHIVDKTLRKDPKTRYQNAADLLSDLLQESKTSHSTSIVLHPEGANRWKRISTYGIGAGLVAAIAVSAVLFVTREPEIQGRIPIL